VSNLPFSDVFSAGVNQRIFVDRLNLNQSQLSKFISDEEIGRDCMISVASKQFFH
jgi:hypothetical protein